MKLCQDDVDAEDEMKSIIVKAISAKSGCIFLFVFLEMLLQS